MEINYEPIGGMGVILSQVDAVMGHLAGLEALMPEAQQMVFDYTEAWFHSNGQGRWPKLAESTIEHKTRAKPSMSQPSKALYAYGNLFQSITSRTGPYSWTTPLVDGIGFGVHWQVRGVQVADVLSTGGGHIPARPIYPTPDSAYGMELKQQIGRLFLRGIGGSIGGAPAWHSTAVRPGLGKYPAGHPSGMGGKFFSLRIGPKP